jgi:hypothetical protein
MEMRGSASRVSRRFRVFQTLENSQNVFQAVSGRFNLSS